MLFIGGQGARRRQRVGVRVLMLGTAVLALACGGGDGDGRASASAGAGVSGLTMGPGGVDGGGDESAGDSAADGDSEIEFLTVEPAELIVELDLGEGTTVDYSVVAHYADGDTEDVTAEATLSIADGEFGSVSGSTLQIPARDASFFGSAIVEVDAEGVSGAAQVTVATYRKSGPQQDFFFVLPYEDPAGSQSKPLTFSTGVKVLDVFFNVDTTGSMAGPIANLQSSLVSVMASIQAGVDDTQVGVGSFEDFPVDGYGDVNCNGTADQPFTLMQAITDSIPMAQAAANLLALGGPGGPPIGCGADGPESNVEALYQIATGDGLLGPQPTFVAVNHDGLGGVGFREGSLPVVIPITDALSHDGAGNACNAQYGGAVAGVAASEADAVSALTGLCGRIVPVAVGNFDPTCGPLGDGTRLAQATGSVIPPDAWDLLPAGRPATCAVGQCCTGLSGAGVAPAPDGSCPLVYRANVDGSGLDSSIVDGVRMLASYAPIDVVTEVDGVGQDVDGTALPEGITTADFIESVAPSGHGPLPLPGAAEPVPTANGFDGVIPNTDVTFEITAVNRVVTPGPDARLFEATIRVLASGCSELDERTVFILVPPQALPPPVG